MPGCQCLLLHLLPGATPFAAPQLQRAGSQSAVMVPAAFALSVGAAAAAAAAAHPGAYAHDVAPPSSDISRSSLGSQHKDSRGGGGGGSVTAGNAAAGGQGDGGGASGFDGLADAGSSGGVAAGSSASPLPPGSPWGPATPPPELAVLPLSHPATPGPPAMSGAQHHARSILHLT